MNQLAACPGSHRGHVRVELLEHRKTFSVQAHNSPLSCLALTLDGSRVATASEKGTILRIFDSFTGKQLQEVLCVRACCCVRACVCVRALKLLRACSVTERVGATLDALPSILCLSVSECV